MKYKKLFFDFDGVIHDSLSAKGESFVELFQRYELSFELKEKIRNYHLENGGINRNIKFQFIIENFLNKKWTEELRIELSENFKSLLKEKLVKAPLVSGVKEFIESNSNTCEMFIVSGAPADEITEILKLHSLQNYFLEIHGSLSKKSEVIINIISKNNYFINECVMFGDSDVDLISANEAKIDFVAINWSGKLPVPANHFLNFKDYV